MSVSLFSISATCGQIITGALVDRYHITNVLLLAAVTSSLCVFLIWGFATSDAVLYLFAILFGVFAGGHTGSWAGCVKEVKKQYPEAETAVVMATMAAGRGVGCVVMGPVSEALLNMPQLRVGGLYGSKYGTLILFTGLTAFLGRFGLFGRYMLRPEEVNPKIVEEYSNSAEEREPLMP